MLVYSIVLVCVARFEQEEKARREREAAEAALKRKQEEEARIRALREAEEARKQVRESSSVCYVYLC